MPSTTYKSQYGSVELLSDINYHAWSEVMKRILRSMEAFAIATGEEEEPPNGNTPAA